MAQSRLNLQIKLTEILGSQQVYYQPPENVRMRYPAIVYNRDRSWDIWGDNRKYLKYKGYMITLIGHDPDSPIIDAIEELPMCTYNRHYVADGLNHDVFIIYF